MTEIDFNKLAAPFEAERVSWRLGTTNSEKTQGLALSYIDARDVMDRLDAVAGPGNWQDQYHGDGPRMLCRIGIKIDGEWIWKSDGAGDTDVEAPKGAISDAFKRAAVKWGIGRYLYDLEAPWVEIEPAGRSYRIKKSERPRLLKILRGSIAEAEPKKDASPSTSSRPESEWKTVAEDLKMDIDSAVDVHALNSLLESKRFAELSGHSKTAGDFLRRRAENRRAALAQRPAA